MNILKQFVKSIYSPKDIAKFRFQGIGKTIFYLFFLTLISVIPTSYYLTIAINNGLEITQETLKDEVPPFVIEKGNLYVESPSPITIEKDGLTIILDSSGSIEETDLKNKVYVLAFLKNKFVLMVGGQPQSYSYTMINEMKLTNQEFIQFLQTIESLKIIFLPIMLLVLYIFSSGIKFIEVSILAAFGLFIISLIRRNVPYRQIWRMAAFSVTLPTFFFTIMAWLQTSVPNGILINWFVSIIVLTLALKEIPIKK